MTTPKFCKDCKHYQYSEYGDIEYRCLSLAYNVITGDVFEDSVYECGAMRSDGEVCGPDAKLFEALGGGEG